MFFPIFFYLITSCSLQALNDSHLGLIKKDPVPELKKQVAENFKLTTYYYSERHVLASVFIPKKLDAINLVHNNAGFYIEKNGKHYEIKSYDIGPLLRGISPEKLNSFLKYGYISVNRMENKDYTIKAHVRGEGGGWITGDWAMLSGLPGMEH